MVDFTEYDEGVDKLIEFAASVASLNDTSADVEKDGVRKVLLTVVAGSS